MNLFEDYSPYSFSFDRLDAKITKRCSPNDYYQRWIKKYSEVFKNNKTASNVMEWDLRCKKALREIFASSTFFIEAQSDLSTRCYASYYFCLYYSLFHALWSAVLMDSGTTLSSIVKITHQNLINTFLSTFANSKRDILDVSIKTLFYDLQYKREYYSYVTPINNLFNYHGDLETVKETLQDCFQLTSFHSLMIAKSYNKNGEGIIKIKSEKDRDDFIDMFYPLFSKRPKAWSCEKERLDPAAENLMHDVIKYGAKPEYIALDLEHQFDEIHTYDSFYDNTNGNKDAITADAIYSFVYQALM